MSSSDDDFFYGNAVKLLGKKIQHLDSGDEDCEKIVISSLLPNSSELIDEAKIEKNIDLVETEQNKAVTDVQNKPLKCDTAKPTRKSTRNCKQIQAIVNPPVLDMNCEPLVEYTETLPINNRAKITNKRSQSQSKDRSRSNQRRGAGRKQAQSNRARRKSNHTNEVLENMNSDRMQTRSSRSRKNNHTTTCEQTVIILDSDEEVNHTIVKPPVDLKVIESVNSEVSFKVWWQYRELNDFKLRRFQKLKSVFDFYSKRENIPHERLLLKIDNQTIDPNDTPDVLNLNSTSVIEAGYLPENRTVTSVNNNKTNKVEENSFQLKIQNQQHKKPWLVNINKTECIGIVMVKYSEEFELDMNKLKFCFDGEVLNFSDTPEMLDLEGGECIDVFFK